MAKSTRQQHHNKPIVRAICMVLAATVFLMIFVILAIVFAPQDEIPRFIIEDVDGQWGANGPIAVFDKYIHPGASGSYEFTVKNMSDIDLRYSFTLHDKFVPTDPDNHDPFAPFMMYRLKESSEEAPWRYAHELFYTDMKILAGAEVVYTLEWYWPGEGNDENDTLIGYAGGTLAVVINVSAEVIYQ